MSNHGTDFKTPLFATETSTSSGVLLKIEDVEEDNIDHPSHYGGDTPYEAIKVIEAWLDKDGLKAFCLGNALKYISRAGKKDPNKIKEDLEKARWYLDYAIKKI